MGIVSPIKVENCWFIFTRMSNFIHIEIIMRMGNNLTSRSVEWIKN